MITRITRVRCRGPPVEPIEDATTHHDAAQ